MKKCKSILLSFCILVSFFFVSIDAKADNIKEIIEYTELSNSISSDSTIIPYKQIYETTDGNLDIASTIYSKDSWINEVIELALSKEGCEYNQDRREAEDIYDCSSFVRRMYMEVTGVYIGNTTDDIHRVLYDFEVPKDSLEVGDLLWVQGHIAMYIGNNQIIHAKGTQYGVIIEDLNINNFTKAFRPIDYIRYIIQ